ncbi:NADH:ubiquinone reductase (Na(+)-transporting) subunit F [Cupriavidus pinatubonensis]|uniref:NADH:ubiquinone reductase (Na(+)-transporting) subunit F n=1 Tax=Cupriavidus pinatubonensis TaxID=248026 RepID=UPI00112C3143|nr:2Fe-2S iron-sulfur cluster binding domain-containing protein [Cupriavidus pinatubonensis]TPQ33510.1 phenol hydroxylase [Cupriavidus pinatubonensis]
MCNQITIEPLGATLDVAEGQTLLDAALRSGVYIPHACGHGLCGTCKVQVTSGEVDHGAANPFALMDFEREEGKTLACCATALTNVCIEADIDEEPDARVIPVRDFAATVTRIETLTPTIKGLRLKLDESIDFQAGQYVMVEIPGLGQQRAFSIANAPAEVAETGEIALQVRRVPGGAGTGVLHEQVQVGDALRVTGPYGRFFVRQSAGMPMLFVAGGSGLSSPRSMIFDLLAGGCALPITLINGQRSLEELYGHDEFVDLAARHPNFQYVPVLSGEPEDSDWRGARGYAHDAARTLFDGQFAGHKAYLCGPPPMVEATIGTLMQGRLFEEDIYTEKFLSAADADAQRSPLFRRV